MSPPSSSSKPGNASAERARSIRNVTLVGVFINSVLTIGQIIVGLFANAFSLVADAMHTLSDLAADFMVLAAGQQGANPADLDHPYGHGRIETVATLVLGISLVAVGIGFLWASGMRLQTMGSQPPLHPVALVMALVALVGKEILFRYTLAGGRRLKSPMLEANAWHARSDAASTLVVAIGIGGSLAGYPFLEPLAAAVVGFIILRIGVLQSWHAVRELIDTGLPNEELVRLRQTISDTPGVAGLHELRTRRMAHRVLCDAHVQVDSRITVSEGHYISESVLLAVRQAHSEIGEVLVHVDTENDDTEQLFAERAERLPDRAAVLADLATLIGEHLPLQRLQLHYLDGRVEIEAYCSPDAQIPDAGAFKQRVDAWLAERPCYRGVSFYRVLG
ncbi:MAG: cation diffusion facilitator family transporter [Proteobacteria bacterium]|jgi:cation diffusion facilitator family transporter|nr:cation diffusion facilitator family transporter [Pseudomonadota bacterium]